MTTRHDVIKGIEEVDTRVHGMAPRLLTHGDAKLPEGEWTVRQALCHLAARSNCVPLAVSASRRAHARAQGVPSAAGGAGGINEVNQRQLEERQDRTVAELLDEIHAGHQDAVKAVRGIDEPTLGERMVYYSGGGEMSFAELLLRAGPGHENNHLDQIEKAIGGNT